jgi:hypothetical protein
MMCLEYQAPDANLEISIVKIAHERKILRQLSWGHLSEQVMSISRKTGGLNPLQQCVKVQKKISPLASKRIKYMKRSKRNLNFHCSVTYLPRQASRCPASHFLGALNPAAKAGLVHSSLPKSAFFLSGKTQRNLDPSILFNHFFLVKDVKKSRYKL